MIEGKCSQCEHILVFGRKPKYYPQMESGTPYAGFESTTKTIGEVYGKRQSRHSANSGTRYPLSVIKFNTERTRGGHPTQKPVALLEYLIKTYTKEGDTVLDSCMGSGTTGIACKNLNRDFVGIELDEKYFEMAEKAKEKGVNNGKTVIS